MNYRISAIVTAFIVMFFVHSASAMDMKDGLWEITTKMEMPGMPMEMPPFKYTQCLTSKDNVPQDKSQDKEHNRDCKIKNTEVSGNTVTWEVLCISEGKPVKSIGQITYKGDSFDGESKTEMDGMNMVQKMSG
ncbi:MAG: DUF3617 family protein, partial [Nitrospirae bacterium]|nr:DUF3617 family protein [Nitrospirota bacterium]